MSKKYRKKTAEELKSISGEYIRRQYFNIPIYIILPFFLLVLAFLAVEVLENGSYTPEVGAVDLLLLLLLMAVLMSPLVILSLLNRKCFGKVVCVLNEKGLYYLDGCIRMIPWEDIRKVAYEPDIPGTHRSGYYDWVLCDNIAYVTTKPFKKEIVTELHHVPLMLLGKMKKYCPKAQYGFTWFGWVIVLFFTIAPILVPIMVLFMD